MKGREYFKVMVNVSNGIIVLKVELAMGLTASPSSPVLCDWNMREMVVLSPDCSQWPISGQRTLCNTFWFQMKSMFYYFLFYLQWK